jgi:hypothetical protein
MANEKSHVPDEMHSWWHTFEMGAFRTTVVAVGVIGLEALIIVALLINLASKDRIIAEINANQVMIGFQNDQGSFVSTKTIPEYFVVRYARNFVSNLLNYGPSGVKENMNEARRMMDEQLAIDYHKYFQDTVNETRQDYITQSFEIKEYSFTRTDSGFIIAFRGIKTRFAGQTNLTPPTEKIVTVRVKRVPITQSTQEGMVVVGVTDKLPFSNTIPTASSPQVSSKVPQASVGQNK